MFEELLKAKEENENRTKYAKRLGWNEFDEEGSKTPASIFVRDVSWGYSVFREGNKLQMLYWTKSLDEAVEWAVDRARKEIAEHEVQQEKRTITNDTVSY